MTLMVRSGTSGGWVHALTPLLFLLASVGTCGSLLLCPGSLEGLIYPLMALSCCLGALPLALLARRNIDGVSVQALYLTMLSLTPWLVFAWPAHARNDVDGGAGGACCMGVLPISSMFMLVVLPLTLQGWSEKRVLAPRPKLVWMSAGMISALALLGLALGIARPTRAGLVNYRERVPIGIQTSAEGPSRSYEGEFSVSDSIGGSRCVATVSNTRTHRVQQVEHRCGSPVRFFRGPRSSPRISGWFSRPAHFEQEFVLIDEIVVGNKLVSARYLLFVSPLWEWSAGALLGIALALWTLRRTRTVLAILRAQPVRSARWQSGSVVCDDGIIVAVPVDTAPAPEWVVIGDPRLDTPFRTAGVRGTVTLRGTPEAWERSLRECESIAVSFALAVMFFPSAPLLAAPFLGMFSPL